MISSFVWHFLSTTTLPSTGEIVFIIDGGVENCRSPKLFVEVKLIDSQIQNCTKKKFTS